MSYVFVPNSKSVVHFVLVDFGGGCSCFSCCCDRGRTKSTPCPTWTGLLSLDWSLTINWPACAYTAVVNNIRDVCIHCIC